MRKNFNLSCPIPIKDYPRVTLAHGGGGKLMHDLVSKMFVSTFGNVTLDELHDSAIIKNSGKRIAFTTDSYVVKPLFFPGGDIGSLAVYGTVNDLAMSGAKPCAISVALIIEEGLAMDVLWRIVRSIKNAADTAKVKIVTGDTKVVDKGKGDGIFINTSGIGFIDKGINVSPAKIKKGDTILISGDIGRHGMAIMAQREGLSFDTKIESDCAPLAEIVNALLKEKIKIHCLRDLTRGGLASILNELALSSKKEFIIKEENVLVNKQVRSACEVLGLEPMYVACEGRFVIFIPPKDIRKSISILKRFPTGKSARVIGQVSAESKGLVLLESAIGAQRIIDMIYGEQLPRIC